MHCTLLTSLPFILPYPLLPFLPDRSPIHQNIKDKIVASSERDTAHIFRTMHNTARVYKNAVAQEVVALVRRPGGAKFEDVRELVSGQRGRRVYEVGDADAGIWTAGIVMGLITDCPSCEVLLRRIERARDEQLDRKLHPPKRRRRDGDGVLRWPWETAESN